MIRDRQALCVDYAVNILLRLDCKIRIWSWWYWRMLSFIFDLLNAFYLHITCKLPLKCALNHLLKSCFFQPFTKARCRPIYWPLLFFFIGWKQKEAIFIGVTVNGLNTIYYITSTKTFSLQRVVNSSEQRENPPTNRKQK